MISVSSATKAAWMSDREVNTISVSFPTLSLTYGNGAVDPSSLSLTEALSNSDNVEFVGCIASTLKVKIFDVPVNVKGKRIVVTIKAGNTDVISLFKGIVDSVTIDANSKYKQITAYDDLYTAGQIEVSDWYNSFTFPATLKQIRDSLTTRIGLTQVTATLPNDDAVIQREFQDFETLQALDVLKNICQFNGCCGIINREGKFEYRFVKDSMVNDYTIAFNEMLNYEEYSVKSIKRVQIRNNEDDPGVTTAGGGNKYIIQSNMWCYNLAGAYQSAVNIQKKVRNITFHPFKAKNNALPFVEVGDSVTYTLTEGGGYGVSKFLVLSRTITGVQFCRDAYEARGLEDQSEYVTDLKTSLAELRRTQQEVSSVSKRVIDYVLPTDIDETAVSDGGNNDALTFEFYSGEDGEKASFYAMLDLTSTTLNADDTYTDCVLTVKYKLDGSVLETATQVYGDGGQILFLNYLLTELTKGNHTFIVNLAVSGGGIS